jgi:hypothetical protein
LRFDARPIVGKSRPTPRNTASARDDEPFAAGNSARAENVVVCRSNSELICAMSVRVLPTLAFCTALALAPVAASAAWHGGGRGHYYHGGGGGAAVGAAIAGGIIGLGLGAAIASNPYPYPYYSAPPPVYYGYPYSYQYAPPGVYYGY